MRYEINQQKIDEGMEEYAKQLVNFCESNVNIYLEFSKTIQFKSCLKEELITGFDQIADKLKEKTFLLVPESIQQKYFPEIKKIIEEGKKSLDSLIEGEKE